MTWSVRNFPTQKEMLRYLNGDLEGSVNLHEGALVDGLTFIVDIGAGDVTVTFGPAKSRAWTLAEIVAKINAAATLTGVASISVKGVGQYAETTDRRLNLQHGTSLVVKSTGTGNAALGFSGAADTTAVILASTDVKFIDHEITPSGPESWIAVINA